MRRPYNDHHFWQERIEWERGCSKRSSAAASRIAAALSAVKGRNGATANRRRRGTSVRSIATELSNNTLKNGTLQRTTSSSRFTADPSYGIPSPSSYYSSSARNSSYAPSISSNTNRSIDLCSSCRCDEHPSATTASLSQHPPSHPPPSCYSLSSMGNSVSRQRASKTLSPSSCLSMTSADVERLVQEEIKRALIPIQSELQEEKARRKKAEETLLSLSQRKVG